MMKQAFLILAIATAGLAYGVAASQPTDSYATDLATVYEGYQHMLAMKEACDTAVPDSRAANDKAFAAWQAQHRVLVQDLRRRVTAMIRTASTDAKDYARNLGKYEGAILQLRQEAKEALLKLGPEELRGQCQRMAAELKSPDADLAKVYAAELEAIRKRK
jgi:hypothetical protein